MATFALLGFVGQLSMKNLQIMPTLSQKPFDRLHNGFQLSKFHFLYRQGSVRLTVYLLFSSLIWQVHVTFLRRGQERTLRYRFTFPILPVNDNARFPRAPIQPNTPRPVR